MPTSPRPCSSPAAERAAARHADLYPELRPTARLYGQVLAGLDEGVAAVLDAIDRSGMRDRTLVFFLSDNGPSDKVPSSPGRLRGHKHLLYEGGVRVPAVMRWPGRITAGASFEPPLHVVDLRPTLLGLAGVTPPADAALDGVDFWPALAQGAPLPREELLYNADEDPARPGAIRVGDWKLILRGRRAELFDLSHDPYETQELARTRPELVADLAARLARYRAQAVPAMPGGRLALPVLDAELRARWQGSDGP